MVGFGAINVTEYTLASLIFMSVVMFCVLVPCTADPVNVLVCVHTVRRASLQVR